MSNEELVKAIDAAWHYIRGSAETEEMHHAMKDHLRKLLIEQVRRATEQK